MPPFVIDVRKAEDSRDVVHRAVQALAEGQLVAFPTETVYGVAASAVNAAAVARLIEVKGRSGLQPLALAIRSDDDALDYAPTMNRLARRLARRCWPGPITLVVEDSSDGSLVNQLPENVQQAVRPAGTIGLRVPAHQTIMDVLRMIAGPVVLTSANRSGEPDPLTAEDVVRGLGEDVALILDDGPSRYGQPSSVVRVCDKRFEMLREGVVPERTVRRLANLMVLLVCTGNTCRSPMAETLMRKHFADRLGCNIDELEDHGVTVLSAGIAATLGGRPSPEAVEVMKDRGLSLEDHESQPVTEQLLRHADLIVTMTRSHRDAIVGHWPAAATRTRLIRSDQGDISDPIGRSVDVYRQCAEQIDAELQALVRDVEIM